MCGEEKEDTERERERKVVGRWVKKSWGSGSGNLLECFPTEKGRSAEGEQEKSRTQDTRDYDFVQTSRQPVCFQEQAESSRQTHRDYRSANGAGVNTPLSGVQPIRSSSGSRGATGRPTARRSALPGPKPSRAQRGSQRLSSRWEGRARALSLSHPVVFIPMGLYFGHTEKPTRSYKLTVGKLISLLSTKFISLSFLFNLFNLITCTHIYTSH